VQRVEVHDAHVVREVIHHPGGAVVEGGDRHRLESHRDLRDEHRTVPRHIEDAQPAVGRVHDQQPAACRRV